jgi:hypothetical protein
VDDAVSLYALASPHLCDALVPEWARTRAARFASLLPPAVTVAAFECRLAGGADNPVDYSVCYRSSDRARALLISDVMTDPTEPAWRKVREELRRWAAQIPLTHSPAVWVEIDSAADGSLRPFLVHTLPEISDDDSALRSRHTREAARLGLALSSKDELLDGLVSLTDRLPAWCAVRHVALRPTETGRILRAICRIPCTHASSFAAGGASSTAGRAIANMTERVFGHASVINLNLDVGPETGPRAGVEFDFPPGHPRWMRLFDLLEAIGLLSQERREALVAWQAEHVDSSADVTRALVRNVLVKVDFDLDGPYQAKAYLPFGRLATIRSVERFTTGAAA